MGVQSRISIYLKKMSVISEMNFKTTLTWIACSALTFFATCKIGRFSDDITFTRSVKHYNLFSWLEMRYMTWSSRLFSETMIAVFFPLPTMVWRITNILMLALLVYSVIRITSNVFSATNVLITYAAFWLMSRDVLLASSFWMSGSLNYLWPVALALFASIYLMDIYRGDKPRFPFVYVISAFLASLGVEQVAPCLVAFSLLVIMRQCLRHKTIPTSLYCFTGVAVVAMLIELLSSGNKVRIPAEIKRWFPEFEHMSLFQKLCHGVRWQFKQFGTLLLLLIIVFVVMMIIIYLQKNIYVTTALQGLPDTSYKKTALSVSVMCTIVGTIILASAKALNFDAALFDFKPLKGNGSSAVWPYVFWLLFFASFAVSAILISKNQGIICFLLLASVAAAAIMYFSPTIDISGERTVFVSSVLIIVAMLKIASEHQNTLIKWIICMPALINLVSFAFNFR